ncbi:MAG: alpha/beta hydrolase-fold protein [Gemmatimonadales bacterium]
MLGVAGPLAAQAGPGPIPDQGQPARLPGALQYDFTSRITGRPYRLTVTPPVTLDPSQRYPALYVLDGTAWFATSSEVATVFGATGFTGTGYVIALGYQTEDVMVASELRNIDLTPFRSPNPQYADMTGGGDAFLRAIYEEIQPFVLAHFRVDPDRQAIWGHSIGGLIALRSMLRDPGKFSTYLLASPTVNPRVMADEAAFFDKVAGNRLALRVLITVGSEEGPGPEGYLTASTLADRLRAGAPQMAVDFTVFSGEGHLTAGLLSLIRSIQFAWPRRP